jgi:hypothetical protein
MMVTVMLGLSMLTSVGALAVTLAAPALPDPARIDLETAAPLALGVAALGLATLGVLLLTIVSFCVWLYGAVSFARRIAPPEARVTHPAWAVGSFFVPLANLWVPVNAVLRSFEATRSALGSRAASMTSGFIVGWWVVWILSNVLSNIEFKQAIGGPTSPGSQDLVTLLGLGGSILSVIAAALCINVVRTLTSMQRDVADMGGPGPSGALRPEAPSPEANAFFRRAG